MAELGKNGGERQPDCGRHLPEGRRVRADQIGGHGGRQHDERRFRGASHQYGGFQRNAASCSGEAQQQAGDGHLGQHHAGDREQQRVPLGEQRHRIDCHAHGDQEHAERQPLERFGHAFDLAVIVRLRDQQPRHERADNGREAGSGRDQARNHHHEQACSQKDFRPLRAGRLGKESREQEPAADKQRDHCGAAGQEYGCKVCPSLISHVGRHRAEREHDGDDRQVLEQQHAECGFPDCRMRPGNWHDERRR